MIQISFARRAGNKMKAYIILGSETYSYHSNYDEMKQGLLNHDDFDEHLYISIITIDDSGHIHGPNIRENLDTIEKSLNPEDVEMPARIYIRWSGGDLPFIYRTKEDMMKDVQEHADYFDISGDWYLELNLNEIADEKDSIDINI